MYSYPFAIWLDEDFEDYKVSNFNQCLFNKRPKIKDKYSSQIYYFIHFNYNITIISDYCNNSNKKILNTKYFYVLLCSYAYF